jgi:hypothetical protein
VMAYLYSYSMEPYVRIEKQHDRIFFLCALNLTLKKSQTGFANMKT